MEYASYNYQETSLRISNITIKLKLSGNPL